MNTPMRYYVAVCCFENADFLNFDGHTFYLPSHFRVLTWVKQLTTFPSSQFRINTWPKTIKSRRIGKQKSKNELKQAVLGSQCREPLVFCVYRGGVLSGRLRFKAKTGMWLVWFSNMGWIIWVFGQVISIF